MIRPNEEVFKYYFYFIQERMSIFWNKYEENYPLTQDPTLQSYKFTNVYRAMDRVSQYLIKNVIYSNDNFLTKIFYFESLYSRYLISLRHGSILKAKLVRFL